MCVNASFCVKEMQRAVGSNGWYSKGKEFQKETALRAVGFEPCFCKAVCLFKKKEKKKKKRTGCRGEEFLKCIHLFFFGGGENIRRDRVKVVEPDR